MLSHTLQVGFDHTILYGQPGTEQRLDFFGAKQVIIVRDATAKEDLQKLLTSTLILTIFESKGLEFLDVVLYNFFSGSLWDNLSMRTLQLLLAKHSGASLNQTKYGVSWYSF